MGCDIHIALEKKVGGKWVMVNRMGCGSISEYRNYARFAKLAGVRGDGPDPKGIPKNVSDSTKLFIDEWGIDGHSHSYMPLEEALPIFIETEDEKFEFPEYEFFKLELDFDEQDEIKKYRIVFFFDN